MKSTISRLAILFMVMCISVPQLAGAQTLGRDAFGGIDSFSTLRESDQPNGKFGTSFGGIGSTLGLTAVSNDSSGGQGSGGLFAKAEDKLQIGARTGIFLASGEPANDMIFYGVYGRYLLKPNWFLGVGADFLDFDFETPNKILKIKSTVVNDASASNTIISAWIERRYGQESDAWKPFVLAGLGLGLTDVDDVKGNVVGGGTYDIVTDGGTEIIPFVGVGYRYAFSKRFEADFAARAQYHIGGWDIKDRTSGLKGSVDDYFAYGGYVGLLFRF